MEHIRTHFNAHLCPDEVLSAEAFLQYDAKEVMRVHRALPGYRPTPLVALPGFAKQVGVQQVFLKDESARFGLNAFKSTGASYAMHKLLQQHPELRVCCAATDGNHGRAVAWAAKLFHRRAVIFVPSNTSQQRIKNIEQEDAEVRVVQGNYDTTVQHAFSESEKHGWGLVQDTAWEGYTQVPAWIMQGYTTILREMEETIHPPGAPGFDFVFLGVGVGSWAAAAVWYYVNRYGTARPKIICVEPSRADGLLESMEQQKPALPKGDQDSIMAGLNCGLPSLLAWPILRSAVDFFIAIPDRFAAKAVEMLCCPSENDPRVVCGESGAAGPGALLALRTEPALRDICHTLGITPSSRILLISTEGNTYNGGG